MFERGASSLVGGSTAVLTAAGIAAFASVLAGLPAGVTEGENIDRIRALEELKAVCAAAQARETAAFDETRRDAEAARGVPAKDRGRGVAGEIALARRESPTLGSRHLGLARALVREMPHTMAALTAGTLSEWRATIIARETGWLPVEGRRHVDAQLADRLTQLGDRRLAAEARKLAQAWDPAEAVRHLARAEKERCVTIRPAPDSLVYLTALLPMVQGIAAWASLDRHAKALIGTGQAGERTRGQVMADTLVERLTGQATAEAVPVEVHLIMTDTTLLGTRTTSPDTTTDPTTGVPGPADHPAWVVGHGPLPAATARALLDPDRDAPEGGPRVWLRRLYTRPETGHLVAMDSKRRLFDGQLRRMVVLRDDTCRTPWCDAPIRHTDHATPHAGGGDTSYANASGLCARCNLDKETEGWRHTADPHHLTVTTPTGHTYQRNTLPVGPGRPPGRPPTKQPPAGGGPRGTTPGRNTRRRRTRRGALTGGAPRRGGPGGSARRRRARMVAAADTRQRPSPHKR